MAKDDFYIVNSWMIEDLELSGVELQCFAIIWSLSRGEKQMYIGGNSLLIKMTKRTEPTVISALKKLCKKGFIKKVSVVVNNVERNYYKAISQGTKEILVGGLNNLSGGTKKILAPNKESNNKEINKEKENINIFQKDNERFVKPTLEEIEEYIKEKGFHFDAEQFLDHYESVGWKRGRNSIKDWKAACRYWEHGNKKKVYEPLSTDEDKVKRFKLWMREKHSGIEFCEKPLTFDGYMRLQREYGMDEVCNQLDYIDANIGKFKKCDIELVIKQYLDKQ